MKLLDLIFPYAATTGDVTVRVQPHYAEDMSEPGRGHHVWRYHIRIENHGSRAVQLLDRYWRIEDGLGRVEEVEGPGVVGEQPTIPPGGAHDYMSGCPLPTSSGAMEGSYGMIDADGRRFRVAIPRFDLVAPTARN
jgi:ApaG protein